MQIDIGILKSKINTDNEELLKVLIEKYSFFDPNAKFSTAYKRHRWNGRKNFITANGIFPTGILPNILSDLKLIDCTPRLNYVYEQDKNQYILQSVDAFIYVLS